MRPEPFTGVMSCNFFNILTQFYNEFDKKRQNFSNNIFIKQNCVNLITNITNIILFSDNLEFIVNYVFKIFCAACM